MKCLSTSHKHSFPGISQNHLIQLPSSPCDVSLEDIKSYPSFYVLLIIIAVFYLLINPKIKDVSLKKANNAMDHVVFYSN